MRSDSQFSHTVNLNQDIFTFCLGLTLCFMSAYFLSCGPGWNYFVIKITNGFVVVVVEVTQQQVD